MAPDEKDVFAKRRKAYVDATGAVAKHVEQRMSTLMRLKAWSNIARVLSGGAVSLQSFVPRVASRPLLPEEVREWEEADVEAGVFFRRSWLRNRATGETRLELDPFLFTHDATLHARLDRGSGGWQSMWAMYDLLGVSGFWHYDEPHKEWDDLRNGIAKAGLLRLLIVLLMMCNLTTAPFGKGGFFQELKTSSSKCVASCSVDDAYLAHFYERLWLETSGTSEEYGTPEHIQRCIRHVAESECLHLKGPKVRMARWFQVLDRVHGLLPQWWAYTCALTLLTLEKCNLKNMNAVKELSANVLQNTVSAELEDVALDPTSSNLKNMRGQ